MKLRHRGRDKNKTQSMYGASVFFMVVIIRIGFGCLHEVSSSVSVVFYVAIHRVS